MKIPRIKGFWRREEINHREDCPCSQGIMVDCDCPRKKEYVPESEALNHIEKLLGIKRNPNPRKKHRHEN